MYLSFSNKNPFTKQRLIFVRFHSFGTRRHQLLAQKHSSIKIHKKIFVPRKYCNNVTKSLRLSTKRSCNIFGFFSTSTSDKSDVGKKLTTLYWQESNHPPFDCQISPEEATRPPSWQQLLCQGFEPTSMTCYHQPQMSSRVPKVSKDPRPKP